MQAYMIPVMLLVAATALALTVYHMFLARRLRFTTAKMISLSQELRDEKERHNADAQILGEQRAWAQEVFESSPSMLFVFELDDDGMPQLFVDVNRQACELLKFSKERLLRMSLQDIEPAEIAAPETTFARLHSNENTVEEMSSLSATELLEKVRTLDLRRRMQSTLKDGYYTYASVFARRLGSTFPVSIEAHRIMREGRPAVMLSAIDISLQLQAERNRADSDRRARDYFSKSAIGVAIYDADRTLKNANAVCLRMFGVPDIRVFETVDLFEADFVPQKARESLRLGQTVRYEAEIDFEKARHEGWFVNTKKGKGHFEILMNNMGMDREFNPKGYYVQVMDLTELKNIERALADNERQLAQAQKMEAIGTLAGGIAHDFNNILTPILGYSEMALDDLESGTPTHNYLREIVNASLRAKELASQILTFSRQSEPEGRPLHLVPIVKEVAKLQKGALPHSIKVGVAISAQHDVVMGQASQIHQVLMNLCTNAAHAMRESGGELSIEVSNVMVGERRDGKQSTLSPGHHLLLAISDTGCGMDADTRDRIFEPFFTTKGKGEGTGMGLAVVHGIVKSLKGSITVESAPGKGTTFFIYIPVQALDSALEDQVSDSLPTGKESVLFVDDENEIVRMNWILLKSLGYRPVLSTSAEDALRMFEREPHAFDLLITDQMMPGLSGTDLAARIHEIRPEIPVILCTGFSEGITEENIAAYGIAELIHKPIGRRNLAQTIRRVLDEHEAARAAERKKAPLASVKMADSVPGPDAEV